MMKARNIENGLALAAAVVVLVGVSFAADTALAEESANITTSPVAIHDAAVDTITDAEKANAESVTKAVESLTIENQIEFEIRLEDLTSTLVTSTD